MITTASAAAQRLEYSALKAKHIDVVMGIVSRRDVFAILPTGYGKSLCYSCLPDTYNMLLPDLKPAIVVVVTPLTATLKDQAIIIVNPRRACAQRTVTVVVLCVCVCVCVCVCMCVHSYLPLQTLESQKRDTNGFTGIQRSF